MVRLISTWLKLAFEELGTNLQHDSTDGASPCQPREYLLSYKLFSHALSLFTNRPLGNLHVSATSATIGFVPSSFRSSWHPRKTVQPHVQHLEKDHALRFRLSS